MYSRLTNQKTDRNADFNYLCIVVVVIVVVYGQAFHSKIGYALVNAYNFDFLNFFDVISLFSADFNGVETVNPPIPASGA